MNAPSAPLPLRIAGHPQVMGLRQPSGEVVVWHHDEDYLVAVFPDRGAARQWLDRNAVAVVPG